MGLRKVGIEEFLELSLIHPVLDVRSPSEYLQAHIPNALSFPLFNDEERSVVGTLYKQSSRQAAIRKGLEYFGFRMNRYLDQAESIIHSRQNFPKNIFLVHCWRGGMRSAGVAWLLDLYGLDVVTLQGGYKAYRKWVLTQFEREWHFRCLGGYTGSAKTEILQKLNASGVCKVIDLEKLASHKGSAFGGIGQGQQPSQEMFENLLAQELYTIEKSALRSTDLIWIEDESQRIGKVNIPQSIWEQLKRQELVFLDIPFESRLAFLVKNYGQLDRSLLLAAISRLQKKMGGLETKMSISNLLEGDVAMSFEILLKYYDKLYLRALEKKRDMLLAFSSIQYKAVDPDIISTDLLKNYNHG